MRDSYVSLIVGPAASADPNTPLFRLNSLEFQKIEKDIQRELELLKLSELRLTSEYTENYVLRPLKAVEKLSFDYYMSCLEIYELAKRKSATGTVPQAELELLQAETSEAGAFAGRSHLAVLQKQQEIDGQIRRMNAEKKDLTTRLNLSNELKQLHTYTTVKRCAIEWNVFDGSFVEAGDTICVLARA